MYNNMVQMMIKTGEIYMTIKIINGNNRINTDKLKSINSNKVGTEKCKFSDALSSKMNKNIEQSLDEIFEMASEKYNVPVNLLKSVAKAESNFNPSAVSKAGAQGIMQLMPGTARGLGVTDSFDAEQNVMGGAKYLRQMLDRFDGNVELSLAAYNAGPGNVLKYGGIPPFKETQNYVAKVMGYCSNEIPALGTYTQGNIYAKLQSLNSYINNADMMSYDNSYKQVDEILSSTQGTDFTEMLNSKGINSKEYAMIMEMYRCKVQMGMFDNSMDLENI